MPPRPDMDLSVIIPSHGGGHRLPATLAALASACHPAGGTEVVVVDDGSPDPVSPPPGQSAGLGLRVLRLTPRRGRAGACNAGIRKAAGRVVLILDDDMTVDPAVPAGHAAAHPPGGEPRAVIGRIDPDPEAFRGRFGRFLAQEERLRRERLCASPDDVSFENCLTGHFSMPRRALLDAGGYDETFSLYGFEDIELGWRLRKGGVRLTYRDELATRHRSDHASFGVHCRRHREAGAMAAVFAAASGAPEVRAYLRLGSRASPATAFHRAMEVAQRVAGRSPGPLRELSLVAGRGLVRVLEAAGPRRMLHAAYHLVRGMHYAAGVAEGRPGAGQG